MTEYQSFHMRRIREERERQKFRAELEGAVLFNGFEEVDKKAVIWIYQKKLTAGELSDFGDDKVKAVEYASKLYLAQKCAFQDVLTKNGFEIASEVSKDYDGRIATLTNHGTFSIFGKPTRIGRFLTMSRVHSPRLNYDMSRGYLQQDLKLGENVEFRAVDGRGFSSSYLRGLAINPIGSEEPELEADMAKTLMDALAIETYRSAEKPSEELRRFVGPLEVRFKAKG